MSDGHDIVRHDFHTITITVPKCEIIYTISFLIVLAGCPRNDDILVRTVFTHFFIILITSKPEYTCMSTISCSISPIFFELGPT